jgi:hypothetical protein
VSGRAGRCPSERALGRAFTEGREATLREHLLGCARCAAVWREIEALRALGRELPVPASSAVPPDALRDAVLAGAAAAAGVAATPFRPTSLRRVALGGALAAAVLAVVAIRAWRDPPARVAPAAAPTTTAAHVFAHDDADFSRFGDATDEVVRLVDGTLTLEVPRQPDGRRFRVVTADAEVEVRGTAFDVEARDDRLAAVRVVSGRVAVRVVGLPPIDLAPGERWSHAETRASPSPSPLSPAGPTPAPPRLATLRRAVPAPLPVASPPVPTARPDLVGGPVPGERAFEGAWEALRAGDARRAAAAFDVVLLEARDAALAEDAAYWKAVALSRAGEERLGAIAFETFLDGHPGSVRAAAAAVMLGWLLVEQDRLTEAERRFAAAAGGDPTDRVTASARAGLDEVARRRRMHPH